MGTLCEPFQEMAASLRPTYESLLDVRTRLQVMELQHHSFADLKPIQVRHCHNTYLCKGLKGLKDVCTQHVVMEL